MGVMIIPTVASLSEDAMSAVPNSLARRGVRAGQHEAPGGQRVVVPAALSGIVAAFVLGISRAIGETMIVTIAAGGQAQPDAEPARGHADHDGLHRLRGGSGDLPVDSVGYRTIFAVGSLLFVITLVMNLISIRLVRKYREVYE